MKRIFCIFVLVCLVLGVSSAFAQETEESGKGKGKSQTTHVVVNQATSSFLIGMDSDGKGVTSRSTTCESIALHVGFYKGESIYDHNSGSDRWSGGWFSFYKKDCAGSVTTFEGGIDTSSAEITFSEKGVSVIGPIRVTDGPGNTTVDLYVDLVWYGEVPQWSRYNQNYEHGNPDYRSKSIIKGSEQGRLVEGIVEYNGHDYEFDTTGWTRKENQAIQTRFK